MLREILDVMQDDPSVQRRWFHDDYFDLFLRQRGGELVSFELCYGIHASDSAVVWSFDHGWFHDGGRNSADTLGVLYGSRDPVDADPLVARFDLASFGVPEVLRIVLKQRLREFARQKAGIPVRRMRFRRAPWQNGSGP